MTKPILEVHNLTAGYAQNGGRNPHAVVTNVNETLHPGELVCLIGPNGAGKSTLLRTLAGMQPALQGTVRLTGQDIRTMQAEDRARKLSLVLTHKLDVGFMTGYALVAMGRSPYTGWMGQLNVNDHAVIDEAVRLVGAQNLVDRSFSTMSDGERQKILIARALAQEPRLMILDEPTAFLDLPRRVECMSLLGELAHRTQRAILLSTHDLDLALRCADKIWLLPYGGNLRVGVPEDLVLSGAFQTAFENLGVQFDIGTGTFQTASHARKQIVLIGSGVQLTWTKRALERNGYTVLLERTQGLTTVELTTKVGLCDWRIDDSGVTGTSIENLLATLSAKPLSV